MRGKCFLLLLAISFPCPPSCQAFSTQRGLDVRQTGSQLKCSATYDYTHSLLAIDKPVKNSTNRLHRSNDVTSWNSMLTARSTVKPCSLGCENQASHNTEQLPDLAFGNFNMLNIPGIATANINGTGAMSWLVKDS